MSKKAKENILYYTEKGVLGKLIDGFSNIKETSIKEIHLTERESKELVQLLIKGKSNLRHRCISIYRHAFISEGFTYNICLSCGDYFKDNELYYIENREEIREYINNLIENNG